MISARFERGFSLIEMLVALLILSVVTLFTTFVVGTIKVTRDSAYENAAFRIADSKLNEFRAGGYTSLPASGSFSATGLADLPQGQASTSVTNLNVKTKEVTVGVSWRGASGTTRSVSLTTLITQSGGLK